VVKPGARCGQLALQADITATVAEILGARLPDNAAEDSVSLLPLLKGDERPVREAAVHHSARGMFAIRKGPWKLILGRGSGGSTPGDTGPEPGQLYNLADDVAESSNLYAKHPEIVAELTALLETYINEGRSTPGPKQENDVPVNWKKPIGPPRPAGAKPRKAGEP
jgi:arylsulfatase A-like enzyme